MYKSDLVELSFLQKLGTRLVSFTLTFTFLHNRKRRRVWNVSVI